MLRNLIIFYLLLNTVISLVNILLFIIQYNYNDLLIIHVNSLYIYVSFMCNLFFYLNVKLLPFVIFITIQHIYTNILCIYYTDSYIKIINYIGLSINVFYFFLFVYKQNLLIKSIQNVKESLSSPRVFSSPQSIIRVLPCNLKSSMESLLQKEENKEISKDLI